jgi:hypothetical protein
MMRSGRLRASPLCGTAASGSRDTGMLRNVCGVVFVDQVYGAIGAFGRLPAHIRSSSRVLAPGPHWDSLSFG